MDQFQIYAGKVFLSLTAYDSVDRQGTFLKKENGPPPPFKTFPKILYIQKLIRDKSQELMGNIYPCFYAVWSFGILLHFILIYVRS